MIPWSFSAILTPKGKAIGCVKQKQTAIVPFTLPRSSID